MPAQTSCEVVYCTLHGRHTGTLLGIPPTNREVAMDYVHIVDFRDGKVADHCGIRDDMALMRQLRVMSGPSAPVVVAG